MLRTAMRRTRGRRTLGFSAPFLLRRILAVAALALAASRADGAPRVADTDLHGHLAELSSTFSWMPIENPPVVQITITGDPGGDWHLQPRSGGDVELRAGRAEKPGFSCELSAETLGRLYRGEMSGMTAAGKSLDEEDSPLEILAGEAVPEDTPRASLGPVFHFIVHFWDRADPEIIPLGREHARLLSGAQIVGLYYYPGFRSAWYSVNRQESLNGNGDSSPYPQAYVVLRGRARVRLGQRSIEVPSGQSIYIPPGAKHAVQSQDGSEVEVLWLAWGAGA